MSALITAAQAGLSVRPNLELPEGFKPIGLLGIWREEQ